MNKYLAQLPEPGRYVALWRAVKAMGPNQWFKLDWAHRVNGEQARRVFDLALQRRINIRGGRPQDNEPIDIGLVRDCRRVHEILNQRIRHYQFESKIFRLKFIHLLSRYDD